MHFLDCSTSTIVPTTAHNTDCAICEDPLTTSEDPTLPLPLLLLTTHTLCQNTFYAPCLQKWHAATAARFRDTTCPLCRRIILPLNQTSTSTSTAAGAAAVPHVYTADWWTHVPRSEWPTYADIHRERIRRAVHGIRDDEDWDTIQNRDRLPRRERVLVVLRLVLMGR